MHFLCMHGSQHIHELACLCRMMDMLSFKAQPLSYKLFIFWIHSKENDLQLDGFLLSKLLKHLFRVQDYNCVCALKGLLVFHYFTRLNNQQWTFCSMKLLLSESWSMITRLQLIGRWFKQVWCRILQIFSIFACGMLSLEHWKLTKLIKNFYETVSFQNDFLAKGCSLTLQTHFKLNIVLRGECV